METLHAYMYIVVCDSLTKTGANQHLYTHSENTTLSPGDLCSSICSYL